MLGEDKMLTNTLTLPTEAEAAAEAPARVEDLQVNIAPSWRNAFAHFIETGEAEEEFLAYLDHDEKAQHAVQSAFDAQVESFQKMVDDLRRLPSGTTIPEQGGEVSGMEAAAQTSPNKGKSTGRGFQRFLGKSARSKPVPMDEDLAWVAPSLASNAKSQSTPAKKQK
jgi:hypothetical protein